ncbi:MAG: TonB-dependent receptor plug domain-containing protein [Candidatus Margulisiibacteriota bacterium]
MTRFRLTVLILGFLAGGQPLLFADIPLPEITVRSSALTQELTPSASHTHQRITDTQIQTLPGGSIQPLSKVMIGTQPGVVAGSLGQVFIRGNHGGVLYTLDGVPLPDSMATAMGSMVSLDAIEDMDIITGGLPAEYGNRLSAAVNLTSKTGRLAPEGSFSLGYGSYNTFFPSFSYGGTNSTGSLRYFMAANFKTTDRGLDTPTPKNASDPYAGGSSDSLHNTSRSTNSFAKVDWDADASTQWSLTALHGQNYFELPIDPAISQSQNTQKEQNTTLQLNWKKQLSDTTVVTLAPYWKYADVVYTGDPTHDLAISQDDVIPTSFFQSRHTNTFGLKGDATLTANPLHKLKVGFLTTYSQSEGDITIITTDTTVRDGNPSKATAQSVYIQDDITLAPNFVVNAGLRLDATQVAFADTTAVDSALSPRLGASYMLTPDTKVHAFYGKLFQPAPAENLRSSFSSVGGGTLSPYDIKAEKSDFYEVGIEQKWGSQWVNLTSFYKSAINIIDETQLLNTPMTQPFNLATGYAYGVELGLHGKLTHQLSHYLNYAYTIAKGRGISGGIFAFSPDDLPSDQEQYLDHLQIHTFNAGLTYRHDQFWSTLQATYGSGLRTGPDNNDALPAHLTFDTTIGQGFDTDFGTFKVALDVLNILDNAHPITLSNGFNGTHYAAGRTWMLRVTKTF